MRKLVRNNRQDGFIALISAIVISAMLVIVVMSVGFTQFFSRLNVVDAESKERSSALAEACVDKAMYNFAQDTSYNVAFGSPQTLTVSGTDQCKVMMVQDTSPNLVIKTQWTVNKAVTDLMVVADDSALTVNSWDECPVLSSSASSC